MGWPHELRSQHPHPHPRQPDHRSPRSIGDWSSSSSHSLFQLKLGLALRLWAAGFGLDGGVGMGGEVQLGRRREHGGGRVISRPLSHSSPSLFGCSDRRCWEIPAWGVGFRWLRGDQIYGDLNISPGISLPLSQSLTRGVFLALLSCGFSPLERNVQG